jgi:hypothetical protein
MLIHPRQTVEHRAFSDIRVSGQSDHFIIRSDPVNLQDAAAA